jgi:uncharacterized protein YllA (UPF0747 family)
MSQVRQLSLVTAAADGWRERLAAGRPRDAATERLFAKLAEDNRRLGVAPAVVDGLAAAGRGEARVVVTGQQPGVLGGPLLTLYKVATAVALAAELEARHGGRVVPLYWMGADDDDFDEIRELVLLGDDLAPVGTRLARAAHGAGAPVGGVATDAVREAWRAVADALARHPGAGEVGARVARALDGAHDHAEATARVVVGALGGAAAVVDGREPLLQEAAREVILGFFDAEAEIRAGIDARGRSLEASGFHAQLSLGTDSGVFVLENGRRARVSAAQRERARKIIAEDIGRAYPGVVLRNLIQDAAISPVAAVLGPAEIAYRAQMAGVHERLGVARPVLFPRLFATYVPRALAEPAAACGLALERLVEAPGTLADAAAAAMADPEVARAAAELREAFSSRAGELVARARAAGDERQASRLAKRIADVERRLVAAISTAADIGKSRALARWPQLAHAADVFARGGTPQERYLWMLAPALHDGEGTLEAAGEAARAHASAALDGRVSHTVYSS